MNLADRRDIYNGFGDTLARAFELVLTPAIFGWFGWLVDRWLGTAPVFMIVLSLLVFGYVAWRLWSGYEISMRAEEQRLFKHRDGADG
jgi:F0F1-type ATP synthase assembly protein I